MGRADADRGDDARFHLLQVTQGSVDDIAGAVGYEDGSTLRTLLRRRKHVGVRELRARA